MKTFVRWALFTVILLAGYALNMVSAVQQEKEEHVFSTWEGFEVDKCASIWLIKRFVDKDALFRFYPKGETLETGIPFDTPDAQLRRFHNRSTFESIVAHYHIGDERVLHVAKIVHDSEINLWGRKAMPETALVERAVRRTIESGGSDEEIISKSIEFFDALYNSE